MTINLIAQELYDQNKLLYHLYHDNSSRRIIMYVYILYMAL